MVDNAWKAGFEQSSDTSVNAAEAMSNIVTGGLKMLNANGVAAGFGSGVTGMIVAPLVAEVTKEVREEILSGNATLESLYVSAEIGVMEGIDKIEESAAPIRNTIASGLEFVSGCLDCFDCWLSFL